MPRFSTIKWALCLPNACTASDAQAMLAEHLSKFDESAGLQLSVQIDDEDCVVRTRRTWSDLIKANWQMSVAMYEHRTNFLREPNENTSFNLHSGYFMFFAVVTVIASLNDYWQLLKLDVLLADPKAAATAAVEEEGAENEPANDEATADEPSADDEATVEADGPTAESDDSGRKCETCNEDHGIRIILISTHPHKPYSCNLPV